LRKMKKLGIVLLILAILLSLFISPRNSQAGLASSPWPMFQHDSSHTGQSDFAGPGPFALVRWTFDTGGPIYSSPVLGEDGTIYIGSDSGKFFAITPNGSKKWEFNAGGQIHSVPAIDESGNLYFGTTETFWVVDKNGRGREEYGHLGAVLSSPCIELESVYFGQENGKLKSEPISEEAGGWFYSVGGNIPSSPIVPFQMNRVYFCANTPGQGTLYAVKLPNFETGELWEPLWSLNLGAPVYSSPSFCGIGVPGEAVLFVGTSQGLLWAFDADGSLKWKISAGDSISSTPAFSRDGSTVYVGSYVGTDRGKLVAFDRLTGQTKWVFDQCGPVYSSPCVDTNGVIYFGSLDGKVYALNPDGSKKWEIQTGGPVYSSPCIGSDGTLYIGSTDGKLYALTGCRFPFPFPTPIIPSLSKVHLLYPSGGETLSGGTTCTIKWTTESPPSGPNFFILILSFSLGRGYLTDLIAQVSGTNSYSWTIPNINTSQARVGIYWGTGTPENPGELLSRDVSGDFSIVSTPTPTPSSTPSSPLSFPDVPSDYWAYAEIMKLVGEGVINGYPDGTFKPEFPVTRAEFSKMVLLSLGYSQEFPSTPSFPDLDPTEWYYGYVEGAAKHGLVKGYPDGTFKPQGNITLAEILTVIVRAKGWSEVSPPGPPPYIFLHDRDDSVRLITAEDWYYGVVGAATQNGLLLFPDYSQITAPGAGSGEYEVRFNFPATRAQTGVFLSRM
jgi:outer membrane protein assembly factor BamB